jgi:cell division protein FtsI (penicillin-binding protein 3)
MSRSSDRIVVPRVGKVKDSTEAVRASARRRLTGIGGLLLLALSVVAARGAQLCIDPAALTLDHGSAQRWDQVTLQPHRGDVLDRNGRRLATSVVTPNIVVDPMRIPPDELPELAAEVAAIVGLPVAEVTDRMSRHARYSRIAMRVHPKVAAKVEALEHPAIWAERDSRRYYTEGDLASQLLGFVDSAGVGREGLEASLDSHLRGGQVLLQRRRDRRGLDVDRPAGADAGANLGKTVHLTIDRTIQHLTEKALDGIMVASVPAATFAIVVDVKTGDILAMANRPGFNPNDVGDDPAGRRNRVVQDSIEAGSVYKPFTVAAALEEGVVQENSKMDCEGGSWVVGRSRIKDDHPHGTVTIGEVIKYSSNICSAKMAMAVGAQKFMGYLADFGFGARTGIPLPGERRGVLRKPEHIRPIELATTAFGQGTTATQLQIAMGIATLANGGVRMKPRLVESIEDPYGVPEFVQRVTEAKRVVSKETAEAVGRMMVMVTEPGGTATRARIPGYLVAGKTGTAQKVTDGYYGTARIGSFVGFVPADDPVIAVVVTVDEPSVGSRFGGIVAAPAFADIALGTMRHLGIPPDPSIPGAPGLPKPKKEEGPVAVAELVEPTPTVVGWDGAAWTLPDLRGLPLRKALAAVQGTGIDLALDGSGRVVEQTPAPGSRLAPGQALSLVLH